MSEAELSELKEWLTNEVKLQRYFEKLTNYGFTSLDLIRDLKEKDLDEVGIVPVYHRTRILKFCRSLNDHKDETAHVNAGTDSQTGSIATETCHTIIDSNIQDNDLDTIEPQENFDDFEPPPLPPKKNDPKQRTAPDVPQRESSLPCTIPDVSPLTGVNYNPPSVISQASEPAKRPPPIPPRADLEPEERGAPEKPDGEIDANVSTTQSNGTPDKEDLGETAGEMSSSSSSVFKEGDALTPKPKPKPRRAGSSTNKSIQGSENSTANNVDYHEKTHVQDNNLSVEDNLPELPKKLPTKPQPRPRPRPSPRPISTFTVPPREESEQISQKGGSLNRYPIPQNNLEDTPTSLNTDNGTYEVVQLSTQPTQPSALPPDDIYDSIDDMKQPPQVTNQMVQMRKPHQPPGIFKGLLQPDTKVRVSMYGMIGYDYESDESEDDILVTDPPYKPRADSVDSLTDGRPVSSMPTTKSRKTSGYLYKQGGQQNNKGWRKRWFVFDGKALRYYRNEENTSESLHIIPVSQMARIEYDSKENGRARFHLVTKNRMFMLASDSMTDANLWAQTLMEAIIQYKGEDAEKKPGGDMSDPDKEGWLKKQGHNVMGDWKKRYVAIKGERICYYDTFDDFKHETPIHCILAKLSTVKTDSHRSRFQIITPNKAFSFQAENEFEAGSWISAIETAIQMGLSDHSVINKVYSNPANKKCADCGKKDPIWAAVNYCVCLCPRCVGIHRSLGVRFSKPRSLLMDERIWNDQLVELMIKIGNENANKLLEDKLPDDDRITPDSDSEKRIEFIYSKYKEKKYSKISQYYGQPEALGLSLQEAVVTDDVLTTMELLLNKAGVKFVPAESEDQRTPFELAKDAGQDLQVELLHQNGGDADDEPPPMEEESTSRPSIEISSPPPAEISEKSGFLLMRKRYWFTLKDRNLKYYRGMGDKDPLGVIDLRMVTSVELHESEDSTTLDIITTEKTYTLKGDTDQELDSWYSAIKNKQVFNIHLSFQELGSDGIPHLVANCLQFVETYGLQQEGIYRVNGNQAKIRALRQSFNQDASRVILTLDDYSVHDVTGTLKKYLRELPEPVFPDNMYQTFIIVARHQDHNSKLMGMKDALAKLPKVNYDTLKRIIGHLTKVIADQPFNRMGIENVSMIFGPTLMSNDNTGRMDDKTINQEFTIIGEMIHYYQWLFDVDDKEMEKDKLMEDAMKKITQLRDGNTGPSIQEFTLDIKVVQKDDNPCLIKVSNAMTAGELCMNIVSQKGLPPENNWALFEVVEKLNLERALQFREKVLPVVMSWPEVFADHGKDNYLIVKENHIQESIQPFVGNTLTLEGQLHVREPKRKDWKQSMVVVKNGKMVMDKNKSFFKSIKSDKSDADQWSLHNLFVYVGVPTEKPQKGIDTSAGFTIVVKADPELGTLTKYLCARDRTEMFRWLAAILNMKHPEGLWNDPTSSQRVRDKQVYLGRQSNFLRRQGSSKHIVDEIRSRQKSLRRSTDRPLT